MFNTDQNIPEPELRAILETQNEIQSLDFSGMEFPEQSFSGKRFTGCCFAGAKFTEADFSGSRFRMCFFDEAVFNGCRMTNTDIQFSCFAGAKISGCDFRNSEMRRKYGIRSVDQEKLLGAAHYLAGKAEIQDVVYKTNVPNGFMIPVASTIVNPTILLESPNFQKMLEYCSGLFPFILIDTPPLGSVADALNIARHCDGSVLVVRSGSTPRKMVENSVQLLRRTESPLLGIVLNRADTGSKSNAYYHRYYGSNGYGYGYGSSHLHNKQTNGGK